MNKLAFLVIGLLLFSPKMKIHAQSSPSYKVVNKIHLPGNSWWDYLHINPKTSHLYVSHGTQVQVVNANTGTLIGTIPHTKGVHGIALAPKLNKGFISDGGDATVTVFNQNTLKVEAKIHVTGKDPDCILYDPYTQRVFTFNGRSDNSTVINAKTNKVLGTIKLPGDPEFAVSDGQGHIFDNIESKSEIVEINPKSMKIVNKWSIAPGDGPSGLAIDKQHNLLFSVCHNKKMIVSNAQKGKVIATLPIGGHVDGASYDPALKRAYSSNGVGTLTVVQEVNPRTFKVLGNFKTQEGARTNTLDTENHHIYLPTASFKPAPKPTAKNPHPRPQMKANSFV
ncbi:MAG TPA: YncE family protein, partial [Balneolaceae bacterium]|nr:YncE family protein [Balneolaceae bacterium]